MKIREEKGITIIYLAIMIIILITISAVIIEAGNSSIRDAKIMKFRTELEIMQAQVNLLNEQYKDEFEKLNNINEFNLIGQNLKNNSQEREAFDGAKVNDYTGYRFFGKEDIKSLGIDGIENEYLINIYDRKVISMDGMEIEGKKCYTLQQITLYPEVGKFERNGKVTVGDVGYTLENGVFKVTLTNVRCSENVKKYTVKYKSKDEGNYIVAGENITSENYSFVVKREGQYDIQIIDTAGKTTANKITLDLDMQKYNSQHPELHIPTGFVVSGNTNEQSVDTGFVIYQMTQTEKDKLNWTTNIETIKETYNQFVWVPVAGVYEKKLGTNNWALTKVSTTQHDTDFSNISDAIQGDILGVTQILGQTVATSENELTDLVEGEIIKKAGGFWVGRYEAGTTQNVNATTINWNNETIYSKAGLQPARYISQSGKENKSVNGTNINEKGSLYMANNWGHGDTDEAKNTVAWQSGLITGGEWDAVCDYIGWATANTNCTSWGNYYNTVSSTYNRYHSTIDSNGNGTSGWTNGVFTMADGTTSTNKPVNTIFIVETGKGTSIVSGKTNNTVQKNIYDIAGNVYEWTTEVPVLTNSEVNPTNNRVLRSGGVVNKGSSDFATVRSGGNSSYGSTWNIGFRLVLYVK